MIALSRGITAAVTAAPPLRQLLRVTLSRFYRAAEAVQPQLNPEPHSCYDYYRADDQPCYHLGSVPMADTLGSVPERGVQWAFIGNPRAKRHVYAQMLSKLIDVPHISMASLVRQELSPSSSLYQQIANAINHGEIVPENIIFGLLSKRLEDGYYRGESGFILDGIPRTQVQAEILDQLAELDLVVNFKCNEDLLRKNEEDCWKGKLQVYAEQSEALEDYYRQQRKLLNFEVSSGPMETWRGLLTVLHISNM